MKNGMSKRLALDAAIVISVVSMAGVGGLAWGQIKERVRTNSENIIQLEEGEEQRTEILIQQKSLSVKIEGMQREQRDSREDTQRQLNRIIQKLDNRWRLPQ
ncbi:hypothetical protein LCGC14_2106290 [marine sediment metagenome]|uniref:Uncharacterized protein n=1 Tax=marine sediment metagenome TaxID=412755 RepID=A0A0F9GLM6_9ZZZZ